MAFDFHDLGDPRVREFMIGELDQDIVGGRLYYSPRLTDAGRAAYPELLRETMRSGTERSLADALRRPGLLAAFEDRRKPSGGTTRVKVPETAPETLAEGEFNRFYVRAVCRRAQELGHEDVEAYRAKPVSSPRPESQAMLGRRVNAFKLLADLRSSPGLEPALGLPPGPNSGLSVRMPR